MACLGIVGTDVHRLPLRELERLAAAGREPATLAGRARDALKGLEGVECAALVTCNRIELVVASDHALRRDELAAAFGHALDQPSAADHAATHLGDDALRHLLRVACSLESAARGEGQILGQVRDAIARARADGHAGSRLAAAFDLALRVGKRVRRDTSLAELGTDLGRLALHHVRPELRAAASAATGHSAPIVLIGTGAMAQSILTARPKERGDPWLVVGRDAARTAAVARRFDAPSQTLADFLGDVSPFRALIAVTRCDTPLIPASLLQSRLPLGAGVVDLGLPRNVELSARAHARLADLDDLRALAQRNSERLTATIAQIEGWIDDAVQRQSRRSSMSTAAPAPFAGGVEP